VRPVSAELVGDVRTFSVKPFLSLCLGGTGNLTLSVRRLSLGCGRAGNTNLKGQYSMS
jgi:hypothetical protein